MDCIAEAPKLKLLLVDLGTERAELNEPLGPGALAAFVDRALAGRCVVEQRIFPIHPLPEAREMAAVDVVGLSTRLGSLARIRAVVSRWREIPSSRRPFLLLGDLIATFATRELLQEVPEAICVAGEGEEALAGILQACIEAGGSPDTLRRLLLSRQVPNLALTAGDRVERTRRKLLDLTSTPLPDRGLAREIASRGGVARIEASRGCAWGRCSFCAVQAKYRGPIRWRPFPPERIVEDLAALSALGIRSPFFTDEDFLGDDPERAIALARTIRAARERGEIAPDLTLYVNARADSILAPGGKHPSGEEVLRELREAGLREVFVGIESGARDQVKRYQKPTTVDRNLAALRVLERLGITLDTGFIMFDPEMSLPELAKNVEFIRAAGLVRHDARMTKALRVEAGTALADRYRERGLLAGPLDVNDLTWPYRWQDPAVEAVHAAFSPWEAERGREVHLLQARTRGELPGEEIRQARRRHLGEIRAVELGALASLTEVAKAGGDPLGACLDDFTRARERLLAAAPCG